MKELIELLEEFIKEKTAEFYEDLKNEGGYYFSFDGLSPQLDDFLAKEANMPNFYIFLRRKDNNLDKTDNPLS